MPGHDDCAKVIAGKVANTSTVNNATNRAFMGASVTGCLTVEAKADLRLVDSLMSVLIGSICVVLEINQCNRKIIVCYPKGTIAAKAIFPLLKR